MHHYTYAGVRYNGKYSLLHEYENSSVLLPCTSKWAHTVETGVSKLHQQHSVLELSWQHLCLHPCCLPSLHSAACKRSTDIIKLLHWGGKRNCFSTKMLNAAQPEQMVKFSSCSAFTEQDDPVKVEMLSHVLFLSSSSMTYSSLSPDLHHVGYNLLRFNCVWRWGSLICHTLRFSCYSKMIQHTSDLIYSQFIKLLFVCFTWASLS